MLLLPFGELFSYLFDDRVSNVNPPTTEVMGFPPLLWVAAF